MANVSFSMNGWRRQLSEGVAELRDIVQAIKDDKDYNEDDLVAAVGELICLSNSVNCTSVEGVDGFTDMSDLEISHLDEE